MRAIGVELQDVLRAGAPPRVASMLRGEPVTIDSDGSTMRDLSHLANVVRATPLATTVARVSASKQVCSVAVGGMAAVGWVVLPWTNEVRWLADVTLWVGVAAGLISGVQYFVAGGRAATTMAR